MTLTIVSRATEQPTNHKKKKKNKKYQPKSNHQQPTAKRNQQNVSSFFVILEKITTKLMFSPKRMKVKYLVLNTKKQNFARFISTWLYVYFSLPWFPDLPDLISASSISSFFCHSRCLTPSLSRALYPSLSLDLFLCHTSVSFTRRNGSIHSRDLPGKTPLEDLGILLFFLKFFSLPQSRVGHRMASSEPFLSQRECSS